MSWAPGRHEICLNNPLKSPEVAKGLTTSDTLQTCLCFPMGQRADEDESNGAQSDLKEWRTQQTRTLKSNSRNLPIRDDGGIETSDVSLASFHDTLDDVAQPPVDLLKTLETRPITVSQLIQEVKGIYAGLAMVEKKCIEIVTQQTQSPTRLSKEQWQSLIALHRTLLNEHHDFFSASHHPITENRELRELAARYAMPARIWRHGIPAFLNLLRHRLSDSLEYMLSFVFPTYSIMALLKDTVLDFEETWIKCLRDLTRYRMAIEEADLYDREIWSNTARIWHDESATFSSHTGHVQYHLAGLARLRIIQQLFLHSKSFATSTPFRNASGSIIRLFNPVDQGSAIRFRYHAAEVNLGNTAAMSFKRRLKAEVDNYDQIFLGGLEFHMTRSRSRSKVYGPEIDDSLHSILTEFENAENKLSTNMKLVAAQHRVLACNMGVNWSLNLGVWIKRMADFRCFVLWLCALHSCHIPMVSAAPVLAKEPDLTGAAVRADFSLFRDWIMPLSILALVTGGDMFIDRSRHRKSFKILETMNTKTTIFWATFNPPAAAAMLALCDEDKAERSVLMFLLGCEFNQFRRCTHEIMSPPEAFILVTAFWALAQHLLLRFAAHDPVMQRVARWMIASFAITVVTKLCAFVKRTWGLDSTRIYDHTHVSGGFALLGDYHHHERA